MTTTVATTITYPLNDAILAAKAVLPHISKSDITPVLQHALAMPHGLIASDRYTVGRYLIDTEESERLGAINSPAKDDGASTIDSGNILISREVVEWVAKIAPAKLRLTPKANPGSNYVLSFMLKGDPDRPESSADTSVSVAIVRIDDDGSPCDAERIQEFDAYLGNYPAMERLITGWKAADSAVLVALNPVFLERVTRYVAQNFKKEPVQIQIGGNEYSDKPGPVMLTHNRLTVLIQPNLINS